MKHLFTFALFLLISSLSFSQTLEEIYLEANPPVTEQESTPASLAWERLIAAKQERDVESFKFILESIKIEFPELFSRAASASTIIENRAGNVVSKIYSGNIYSGGTATQSGNNPRTLRVRSDANGVQYVAFINGTRDSLMVFKSADNGASWLNFQNFTLSGGAVWQGVDFQIADSAGAFKLGFAVTSTSDAATLDGTLYFMIINSDGSGFRYSTVEAAAPPRGFINPSIVSDAYYYDPALTSWYIGYQNFSTSTPTGNPVKAAASVDWGTTWTLANARTGFNDYDVEIEVNNFPGGDTVYVLLTNNLTLSNANLRIRKVALSNFTGTWSQYNPANSALPEMYGSIAVNRGSGDMVVSYTVVNSGIQNVACTYTNKKEGYYFQAPLTVAGNSYNERMAVVKWSELDGLNRIVYLAGTGTYDSVIYKSTADFNSGNFSEYCVNTDENASGLVYPDVSGKDVIGMGRDGFVVFAGKTSGVFHTYTDVVPVELTSFKAFVSGNSAVLSWTTASETNNHGFTVEVKEESGTWTESGFVPGNGTTTEVKNYSYTINNLKAGTYFFRLRQVDYDGSISYSNEIESEISGNISFELYQNYPNPFNPSTEIKYSVKETGLVSIKLFDMLGREVSVLVNEVKDAGLHSIKFDGSNLASGVYMYSISVNEFNAVKKMILNK